MFRILVMSVFVSEIFCFNISCGPCTCKNTSHGLEADCLGTLNHSTLYWVPKDIDSKINVLKLNNQPLKYLPNKAFLPYGNVTILDLIFCQLEYIHKNAFVNLTNLEVLDLNRNKITELSEETFKQTYNLQNLFLNDNKLTELKNKMLYNLTRLKVIDFNNNSIQSIDNRFFKDNTKLVSIILSNNKLYYMDGTIIGHLNHLHTFHIFGNPWDCYCNLTNLHEKTLKYLKIHDLSTPKCENPSGLHNIGWNEINEHNFTCEPTVTVFPETSVVNTNQKEIKLTCKVDSNPVSRIEWSKNGKIIKSHTIGGLTTTYNITVPNSQETNKYTCNANNNLGSNEKHIKIKARNDNITITFTKNRSDIFFRCTQLFSSKAYVQWRYRKQVIANGTTNKYTIFIGTFEDEVNMFESMLVVKNILAEDAGQYSCINSEQKTVQFFNLIISKPTEYDTTALIVSFCVVFFVLLVVVNSVWYYIYKKLSKKKLVTESISLRFLSDKLENEDDCTEESPIYMSS